MGELLMWFLYFGANTELDANRFGSITSVLFFILSLQTGLTGNSYFGIFNKLILLIKHYFPFTFFTLNTGLEPEKRLDRLFKNFYSTWNSIISCNASNGKQG